MKFPTPKAEISISNRTVVRVIAISIGALILFHLVASMSHALTLFAIAFFLALALNPLIGWLTRKFKSRSRIAATGVAYLGVISALMLMGFLVVPPIVRQTSTFVVSIPGAVQNIKDKDNAVGKFIRRYNLEPQVDKLSGDFKDKISNKAADFTGPVFSTASKIGSAVVSVITVLVLTFMMLVEGPLWLKRIWELTPEEKRNERQALAKSMYRVVTGYVNGQVLIAAIAAMFAMTALFIVSSIFNTSVNAIALGGIVFLFGLIPLIGNSLAAVVVVLACLFASTPLAIAMAIYFLLYQQIENVTLQPYIQSKSNQLTPLIVFTAALLGASVGGLLGALVAIPVAGCIKVYLEYRWSEKFPGNHEVKKSDVNNV